jgi:hypothetical protein
MDENWMMIKWIFIHVNEKQMMMNEQTNERTSYIMDENWTMTNEFYSYEWKVNDVDWISYIMDEK